MIQQSRLRTTTQWLCAIPLLLAIVIVSLAHGEEPAKQPDLPRILIIGDSISGGYYKAVTRSLQDRAVVMRNEGNAEWTGTGIKKIDEWLGDGNWDIIHFNWGLWDMYGWRYFDQDRSPKAYAERLDQLVTRIKATNAKLIWATTTPACPGPEATMLNQFKKEIVITPEIQLEYQNAALEVMKKHGVEVNDLYHYVLPDLGKFSPAPDNVHFTGAGNGHLARRVVEVLGKTLDELSADR